MKIQWLNMNKYQNLVTWQNINPRFKWLYSQGLEYAYVLFEASINHKI
jgi:hypothetical protein